MKNFKLYIFFFFFLLSLTNLLNAQNRTIKGTVFNGETNEPIKNITVSIQNTNITTITNNKGEYKIDVPEEIKTVSFSDFVGMTVKEIRILGSDTYNIYLSNNVDIFDLTLEQLMQLEVTSVGKTTEKAGTVPASIVIMNRNDIENYGFSTITEILEHVSGLYNINTYGQESGNFGVRGFYSGVYDNPNFMILYNNIPQDINKMVIPVEAIDRIEIIRGPMAVMYGSGAMFGVINIITNLSNNSTNVIAKSSYGSYNSYNFFAKVAKKINNDCSYAINLGYYQTDGLNYKYTDLMDTTNFQNFAMIQLYGFNTPVDENLSTKNQLEQNYKYFDISGNFKGLTFNVLHKINDFDFFFLYPALNSGNEVKGKSTDISVSYNKQFLYYFTSFTRMTNTFDNFKEEYDLFVPDMFGYSIGGKSKIDVEQNFIFNNSKNFNIVFGGNYKALYNYVNLTDVPEAGDPALMRHEQGYSKNNFNGLGAMFLQTNLTLFNNLKFVAGIRYEQNNTFKYYQIFNGGSFDTLYPQTIMENEYLKQEPIFNARFATVYSLDNHIFKFMFGQASQQRRREVLPERIQTFEFNYSFLSSSVNIFTNVFYNSLNDLVVINKVFNPENMTYTETTENSGKMNTMGSELTLIITPIKKLSLEMSATYQQTKDENLKNIEVAYSPNLLGQFKINYKISKFTFAISAFYVDKMQTAWISEYQDYDPYNNEIITIPGHRIGAESPAYYNLNANLRVDNILKGFYAQVHFTNLLDTKIRYPTQETNSILNNGTIGYGRAFNVTLGYKF